MQFLLLFAAFVLALAAPAASMDADQVRAQCVGAFELAFPRQQWTSELAEVRKRIIDLRRQFTDAMSARVPERDFSYSDHEGVTATIRLRHRTGNSMAAPAYRKQISMDARPRCVEAVSEALHILHKAAEIVDRDELHYAVVAALLLLLLLTSFVPIALLENDYHAFIEMALFLPRFSVTIGFTFFAAMATLFNKRERNAINSAKTSLKLIKEQG